MKIEKNYILYFLVLSLGISLFLNFKGCHRSDGVVDPSYHRKIDSLRVMNNILSADVVERQKEIDSLNIRVGKLDDALGSAKRDIASAKDEVNMMRSNLAETDRKLRDLRKKKIDLSDDDLDSYLKDYFDRPKK